jgi:hypothetical protein
MRELNASCTGGSVRINSKLVCGRLTRTELINRAYSSTGERPPLDVRRDEEYEPTGAKQRHHVLLRLQALQILRLALILCETRQGMRELLPDIGRRQVCDCLRKLCDSCCELCRE